MIFSQGGGGVSTPYQHPVAMYAGKAAGQGCMHATAQNAEQLNVW
jgi:hypothetical protein